VPASAGPIATTSASVKKTERKIVRCANRERAERGIKKLKVGKALGKAARLHAKNMLRLGFFDHVDPRGRSPQDRVNIFQRGSWAVGENIAAGYPDVKSTCEGWMDSPGHRANILNPAYTHIGGGYAEGRKNYGRYYVQVFGIKLPGLPR
jgi:uncharacterized protein YkwD